jgi:CYTH domain-containing protein
MGRQIEIERKFLVKRPPPGWKRGECDPILQGYLPVKNKSLEIRLRRKGSKHFVTVKCGHGVQRLEVEIEIPEAKFRSLWRLTRSARIAKNRYRILYHGHTVELDVYQRPHRGLMIAEIEFKSGRQSRAFQPPDWLGREVTGSRHYANRLLSRTSRPIGNPKRR